MKWSENVTNPPMRLAPDFDPRDRAYPYADTTECEFGGKGGQELVSPYIVVNKDSVLFIGQRGSVKEVGVNGCQIDDMITFALGTIRAFNSKFPCRENSIACTKLEEALHWLESRKRDREDRNVEGREKE